MARPIVRFRLHRYLLPIDRLVLSLTELLGCGEHLPCFAAIMGHNRLPEEGGCASKKMSRSLRSGADGGRSPRKPDRAQPSRNVVAHKPCLERIRKYGL